MKEDAIYRYKFGHTFRVPPFVSCNGLLLEFLSLNDNFYVISNLSTLRTSVFPPFPHKIRSKFLCGMGYDAALDEYKVVVTYGPLNGEQCAILTIGVDESWRNLCIDYLSPTAKGALVMNSPLITEGFMHWEGHGFQVVTLDVGTEIMYETPPPIPRVFGGQNSKYFMTTGRYLSLLIAREELLWEVREMRPETGEWLKLPDICLETQKGMIERLGFKHDDKIVPCGWLKYPEVLAFRICGIGGLFIIFYDLLTKKFRSEKLSTVSQFHRPLVHKNSLVWLDESLDLYSSHSQAYMALALSPSLRRSRSLSPDHYPDPL